MSEKSLYLTINEVQQEYLPIGKKKLRKIMQGLSQSKRNGNRILVNREELLSYLADKNQIHLSC